MSNESNIKVAAALLELSTAGVVQALDRITLEVAGADVSKLPPWHPIADNERQWMRETAAELLGLVPRREVF